MDKYTYDVLRDIAKQLYDLNRQINLLGQTLLTQNKILVTMGKSINVQNDILVTIGKSIVENQEKMEDEQNGNEP